MISCVKRNDLEEMSEIFLWFLGLLTERLKVQLARNRSTKEQKQSGVGELNF